MVSLPGRFEHREWCGRTIIFDGAHNPAKIASVIATLQELFPAQRFPWILALKQDKDLTGILDVIAPVASTVVATEFHASGGDYAATSSIAAPKIVDVACRVGLMAAAEPDPRMALELASERSNARQPIVVAGSFHLLAALNDVTAAR